MNHNRICPALKRVFCVLLLLFSLVLTLRTAWVVSFTLLDSDTSSELILGQKLAREGGIMSSSWLYSTELQVIDSHVVYSLLFRVCSDWSTVRFIGSVLMNLMMLGSFAFLSRQARIPFNRFCVGGAALMLPFSIPYGRIILYHNYYSFHVFFSFLMVGLYLGALRRLRKNEWKRWPFPVFLGCLALTAFVTGLAGVRHLMICIVPLAVASVLCALMDEKRRDGETGIVRKCDGILLSLIPLAFAGAGYLINLNVLEEKYTFTNFSDQTISMGGFADLHKVLYNTFVDLGFQDFQKLFSAEGLLGIAGVIVWIVFVILAVHTARRTEEPSARFLQVFALTVQFIMACVFIFLSGAELLHLLYLLPVLVWIIPALSGADLRKDYGADPGSGTGKKKAADVLFAGDAPLSVHSLLGTLAALLLAVNGIFYSGFFRDPKSMPLEYTGLQYNDTSTVAGLRPVADYLKENGYTMVYASYWDAAVITELSDGTVQSVPVQEGTHKHPIKYMTWMSDTKLWDPENVAQKKVAVAANMELAYAIEDFEKLGAAKLTSIGGYTLFELPDPAALAKDLD